MTLLRTPVTMPNGGHFTAEGYAWVQTGIPWAAFRSVIVQGPYPPNDGVWPSSAGITWRAQERDGAAFLTFAGRPDSVMPLIWIDHV